MIDPDAREVQVSEHDHDHPPITDGDEPAAAARVRAACC